MPEGETSASAIRKTSMDPKDVSLGVARGLSVFKERSLDTAKRHLETWGDKGSEVKVCFLGDSMFERFSTTGQWDPSQRFPSEAMLPQSDIDDLNRRADHNAGAPCERTRGVANFGCGGDKIENVLFRVIGDESQDLAGLAEKLYSDLPERSQGPKLWVIHAGTNNLKRHKGLNRTSLRAMEALLDALYHLASPKTRFLLTGLFYRKDIADELVDEANRRLKDLVIKLQNRLSPERPPSPEKQIDSGKVFEFLAPGLDRHTISSLLDDHVHLNLEGYRIWMKKLHPKVAQMLSFEPSHSKITKHRGSSVSVREVVDVRSFSESDPPSEVPRSPPKKEGINTRSGSAISHD